MSQQLKLLPKTLHVFSDLITEGFVYVDKTKLVYKLVQQPKGWYFLSRPRRFGKSLLISTLEALFQSKRELFEGLWIADSNHSWEPSPIIRLDFSGFNTSSPEALSEDLSWCVHRTAKNLGISLETGLGPSQCLTQLVDELVKQGQPVILIDEYDAPLVKRLHDSELTRANRDVLGTFFTTLKTLQSEVRFSFITGVSQFAKVSLFSGLNNLEDISFSDQYSTLMGFTEEEIRSTFSEHLKQLSERKALSVNAIIDEIREWYNGYLFAEEAEVPRVYNPWSVIQFLASGKFENYWFASATPTFAINKIRERNWTLADLQSEVIASSNLKNSWDPDHIGLVPLLYQTGYLTIDKADEQSDFFSLRIPNKEVRQSITSYLLVSYAEKEPAEFDKLRQTLKLSLTAHDMDLFFEGFNTILADISYHLHIPQERFYHSLLHMCLVSLGFRVETEVKTSRGRIDMVLHLPDCVFIFELKIDKSAANALKQIKDSGYAEKVHVHGGGALPGEHRSQESQLEGGAHSSSYGRRVQAERLAASAPGEGAIPREHVPEKYRLRDKPIQLIGVRCSSKLRSVEEWKQELVQVSAK